MPINDSLKKTITRIPEPETVLLTRNPNLATRNNKRHEQLQRS